MDDPLNLMRVMPPKGGPNPDGRFNLSHASFSAHGFLFNHEGHE
jgi:hypothetical protein